MRGQGEGIGVVLVVECCCAEDEGWKDLCEGGLGWWHFEERGKVCIVERFEGCKKIEKRLSKRVDSG